MLKIVPAIVELRPGESQVFEAYEQNGQPATNVTWTLLPPGRGTLGSANDIGVYSTPSTFFSTQRVAIVAEQNNQGVLARGSAVVDLDPSRSWVPYLGAGQVLLFLILLGVLVWRWSDLCPQCGPPGLFVSPPVVTLGPGQSQQFLANAEATWTNTVNAAGLYIAPSTINAEQLVTVTATSKSDPTLSAMGVVRLTPSAGLAVLPSRITVAADGEVDLTASVSGLDQVTPTWLAPAAGTISGTNGKGVYKAPRDRLPQTVVVLAQARIPESPARPESPGQPALSARPAATLLAGALVSVAGTAIGPCEVSGSTIWRLILLVVLVGAIGGLTHAMGSFGTYVGNRELKVSWLWWYALRPALSAAVAVIVFFVFRAGFATPDLGLAADECLTVAGFSGLVGLFAEPATVKLKDIFEAIFTPRRDLREDKSGQATSSPLPVIDSINPGSFKAGQAAPLTITGKNFSESCNVQIGGQSFETKRRSASVLDVSVPKGHTLQPGIRDVIVFNKPPQGDASQPAKITVE